MSRFIIKRTLKTDRYEGVRIATQERPDLVDDEWNRDNNDDSPMYDRRVTDREQ